MLMNTPFGMGLSMMVIDDLLFRDTVIAGLVGDLFFHQWRLDVSGADRIDGDVGIGGFQRDDLGESDQAMLCSHIGAFVGAGHQRMNGARY